MLASLDEPGRDDNEVFFDKLRAFVVTHDTSVNEQVRSMNAERIAPDHWDAHTDVVTLDLSLDSLRDSVASVLGSAALHNALFHRTVLVLTSMKIEMKALTDELYSTLLPPIALYGDPAPDTEEVSREEGVLGLGRIIPMLMDLWNWHDRVKKVVKLCVQQFAALYSETHAQNKFAPYQEVQLPSLWYALFDLLGSVAAVEETINQHEMFTTSVHTFHRIMENVKRHPDRYDDANVTYIEEFGRLLMKLETDLMQRQMLNSIAGAKFDTQAVSVSTNASFFNAFLQQFEAFANKDTIMRLDGRNPMRLISVYAAYVLFDRIFTNQMNRESSLQKRLTTGLYALHTVVPVVPIIGPIAFRTASWLTKRFPMYITQITKDPQKDSISSLQEECKRLQATLENEVRRAKLAVAVWQSQFLSSYSHERDRTKPLIADMTDLILRGVAMAHRLRHQITLALTAFEVTQMSLSMGHVSAIHVGIDLLMTIRMTYHTKGRFVAAMYPILLEHHSFLMAQILYDVYKRLTEELQKGGGGIRAVQAEALTDQQCAVGQILSLLGRPLTKQCITCMEVSMHVAFHRDTSVLSAMLGQKTIDDVFAAFSLLRGLVDHQRALKEATDCDFLYWQRDTLLPLFVRSFYKQPMMAQRLRPLTLALHDSIGLILTARHVKDPQRLVKKYEAYVHKVLDTELLRPLYLAIETDLRMHAHTAVLNEPYKGIGGYSEIQLYSRLTQLPPIRLFGKWFSVAQRVENYLDETFYNLNAITLNDGKTYDEMRTLARTRYGLSVMDSFLPGSVAEQGLDVMLVTKNIHQFVANYTYNLNEQLFVQRPVVTDAKYLSTLHIRHVANSIRTHGTGMMNTTVNYVYKCLLKKLAAVSQFLYDDHIRSKLMKDIKFFQEQKHTLHGRFPVKRAEKFCAEVRKLGVTDDNRSYLDQFRELVATIGNALGYMRMVRSGGLRCIAEAAACIPALDNVPFFEKVIDPNAVRDGQEPPEEELAFVPQVSEVTADSVRVLDQALGNMTKRLADGSDYFLMLQQAIAAKLQDQKKYGHLRHFYMIVPALSMSFVDMMIHQKERLMKKNKEGLFTDDGFALGCVFLLALFSKHSSDFDSLHWFESVVHHFQEKRAQTKSDLTERIEQQRRDGDTFASQTIQLTLTMVESSLAEYSALQQSFNSCRVFFQSKKRQEAEGEEGEDEDAEDGGDE